MLPRAWMSASEEIVAGNDPRARLINKTVYRRVAENIPDVCNVATV